MLLPQLPPLSLYIHVPWCVKKCPYCDFNSHELKQQIDENLFVKALLRDFEYQLPDIQNRIIKTVFFGGGTPSLLSPQAIDAIIQGIHHLREIDSEAEITLEANPGTFEVEKFRGFRSAGINRLSLGVQSLNDRLLKNIGRIHNANEALLAIEHGRLIFNNMNCDLMYGLPGQSIDEIESDLKKVLSFNIDHVSYYQLTIEPNTYFYKYPPIIPSSDELVDAETIINNLLKEYGFEHYEVSAYAKKNYQSKHNLNYWSFGDYVGIGPGAHGKISFKEQIIRTSRMKHPTHYLSEIQQVGVIGTQIPISEHDLPFEFMMNSLRLLNGIPVSLFAERTGLSFHLLYSKLMLAKDKKLLYVDENHLKPTELGQRFLNDLIGLFLHE